MDLPASGVAWSLWLLVMSWISIPGVLSESNTTKEYQRCMSCANVAPYLGEPDCADQFNELASKKFEVRCSFKGCFKRTTIETYGTHAYVGVVRSCNTKDKVKPGCTKTKVNDVTTTIECYCEGHTCNSGHTVALNRILYLTWIVFFLLKT